MMHTNGGDRWQVIDSWHSALVDDFRSQVKAYEKMNELNDYEEDISGKSDRFVMKRWEQ